MTNILLKKQLSLALSCALALGLVSIPAAAETSGAVNAAMNPATNPTDTGYLTDQRATVVRSNYGLCWHTGTGPAGATSECDPAVAPAPAAAVAPTPAPMAVAAVAPAPVAQRVAERVTLDADALFDFDKAVLRPAGRTALDDFYGKTKDIAPEAITAVGHTDRFGSEAYNQRLSEQRVEAVRAYLVAKGIEPSRMHTEAKGETQPVTKAGECDGAKSAKVIACLQPDRRVDIEIIGNRIAK